tara:strand:+ start:22917 stop:23159 length:243 start_codon:yes stop_codon:yes gene_type:complete
VKSEILSYSCNITNKGYLMDNKKTQVQLSMSLEQKEVMAIFSKRIAHASTLGGWLKALAFREIDNASPEQKEKLERLLGV